MGRQNYYDVRDAVADRLNFFGRYEKASELIEALNQNRHIALLGLRKMGKSSLLQYLRDQITFPTAYIDLQNGCIDDRGGISDIIYSRILEGWQASISVKLQDFQWTPPTLGRECHIEFAEATRNLLKAMAKSGVAPRLSILLDEFDLSTPKKNNGNHNIYDTYSLSRYIIFTRTLRGIVEETKRLVLVVSGVDPRFYRTNFWTEDIQNPLYKFFREEYLGPLSDDDCIEMIRNIGKQMNLLYDEGALSFVFEASGGHPYLARQLCSLMYKSRGEKILGPITLVEMKRAYETFVAHPDYNDSLAGIWQEVIHPISWSDAQQNENRRLLNYLVNHQPCSKRELLSNAQHLDECESSIAELELRSIIGDIDGALYIRFGLFRRWLEKYQRG